MIIERYGEVEHGMTEIRVQRGVGFTLLRMPVDIFDEFQKRFPRFNPNDLPERDKEYLNRVGAFLPEADYRDQVNEVCSRAVTTAIYQEENAHRQPAFDGGL
jgi:hypothetical protein